MSATKTSMQVASAPMNRTVVLESGLRWEVCANATQGQVTVTRRGILIGFFSVLDNVVAGVEVRSDFQRRGIATRMHEMLVQQLDFRHANTRTRAGNAWTKTLSNYKKAGRLIAALSEPQLG